MTEIIKLLKLSEIKNIVYFIVNMGVVFFFSAVRCFLVVVPTTVNTTV